MIVTKSEFAEKLRITPGRISQYLTQGMPQCDDGRLVFEEAIDWITENIGGKAAYRAEELRRGLARPRAVVDDDNPVTRAVSLALGLIFAQIPFLAKAAAHEAGASPEVLSKIVEIAHRHAIEAADQVSVTCLGQPAREWPDLALCTKFAGKD
jgi:hypothetical protein